MRYFKRQIAVTSFNSLLNSVVNALGLAPGAAVAADGWEPRAKRLKEHDLLENSQITSIDFLQMGSVSTGLGLSLNDRRAAVSSGEPPLLLLPMVDEGILRDVQSMEADMDRFIKIEVMYFIKLLHSVLSFLPFGLYIVSIVSIRAVMQTSNMK